MFVLAYARTYGIKAMITRCTNNYGMYQFPEKLIPKTIMMLEIAERKIKGIFHLAGATRVSRFEFAEAVAHEFGLDRSLITPSQMEDINWIAARPKDSSLDTSKAESMLNEKPFGEESLKSVEGRDFRVNGKWKRKVVEKW